MSNFKLGDALKLVLLFVAYFATATFGLRVSPVNDFATLVWIPTGLSLAFLILFGLRFWPAILLGAFFVNLNNGASISCAVGISIGNALEAVVGAYILVKIIRFRPVLDRVRDVVALILIGAGFSTAISATIGTTSLLICGNIDASQYNPTWTAWWTGDMISDLVLAPFILVWFTRPWFKKDVKYYAEFITLLLIIVIIGITIFGSMVSTHDASLFRTYLVFPPLIWLSLRMGPREAISGVFVMSIIATWGTAKGYGPYAVDTVDGGLRYLQGFMSVVAVTTMILVAALCERKDLENKKDEFISIAGHELKTPLTSIKTLSQALQLKFERQGDEQSSGYLNRVNSQINRLTRLVVELLDVTKMQEGKLSLNKDKCDLRKIVESVVEDISDATSRNIIIKGRPEATINCDRDRISQVLTNLLTNADSHSPPTASIIVYIAKQPKSITVSVRDFGEGIPASEQPKIFDRFYQIDNGSKKASTNMGLGLYIAKEIVSGHGGRIWVNSKKGKGSVFSFMLPAR